ncbi:CCR4-NOT transcription complex subunit 6-like isoform X1 [Bactrocera tryoni]|uniref:CCR4-NOT transcription complex subunit 6-like isoform X1 n=1 Tax=Bactrocera tryoni TaxID=59916 RepID=UPI001A95D037|nr:CCR4-NOT transcription complex subunit 6-like isoform X1 [Bactrocera tryoni]XP_039968877.1 CCR4-NOT transcription complex subunit 6-like isoform X1 [Bactrocera tryoni]XP_039968883.1 CCR4-NOT transcription complex subunit 6-like isoform X1 [Bactrocera tryoni]XP_039968885.1 CCR4-NOT transcription complex subunit 6-like isoform X1 [Bactrocera tryoni]
MKGNLYKMSRNKEKYETTNRRQQIFMSAEDVAAGKKSSWTGIEITAKCCVRNISPSLWEFEHLTALYLNDNQLLRLPGDIGLLSNLRTLDLSSNKLRSLPAELGELIQLRELLLNNNYLRNLPYEIGKLFHLHVLGLMGNPLQKEFLSIYNEPNGTQKLLTYMLDNLSVSVTPPPQRPWIPLAKPNKSRPACIFTVMCYNVLCDKYATRQMYGYCPSWALSWEYRKKAILDEIRHYSADIISLQEIETEQFYNFFLLELKADGYEGIFSPKSRAKTMSEMERKFVDGCAIFFRAAKFTLIKEHLIEFNQLAMANAEGSDNMLNRVMPKDNIGLAALLKVKENAWDPMTEVTQISQPLLVCTAHIHWDPEFCDVKLIQTMMLSNELKTIIDEASHSFRPGHKNDSNSVQLLLCGDFNSLPDSGVIEFLGKGRVAMDHQDFKDMGYKSCLQRLLSNDTSEFTHSFKLASAYSEDIMPHTNYTFDFKGIIDYIFYTKTGMVPLGLLGPISNEWLRENKVVGCPHPHIPSDHFPLLVELELMHTAGQQAPPNGLINRR